MRLHFPWFLLFLSFAANFFLYFLYHGRCSEVARLKRLMGRVKPSQGVDSVVGMIAKDLSDFGITYVAFLRKKQGELSLESDRNSIPVSEHSSAVKALFTQIPQYGDVRYEVDRYLFTSIGMGPLAFIPLRVEGSDDPCWRTHNCPDKECPCRVSRCTPCWTNSEKRFRGGSLETYAEKTRKCIACRSFQPLGVLVVRETSFSVLQKAHSFIEKNFTVPLTNAVHSERDHYLAMIDELTGIPNTRSLMMTLKNFFAGAARSKQPLSFAMVDIDHFKKFNDTYGHQTGDVVLRKLAELLQSSVREADVVARYGGEEFSIILPQTDKHAAWLVLERLRKAVESHCFTDSNREFKVTISIGVAAYPDEGVTSIHTLIEKADAALYHSKETSRNKVTIYGPRMPARKRKRGDSKDAGGSNVSSAEAEQPFVIGSV